jgi:short-subunit dehydrogenase
MRCSQKVLNEVGAVTILINNAGTVFFRKFLNQSESEVRKTFEVNILAHFWILQAFLPKMIEMNHGHVVAISSMAGLVGELELLLQCHFKRLFFC